ncbi:ABC1 kinase family protein [Oleiharenicola lentus]|uniref:ABC1 kinase family protein n=1 Tax=Oleiharenicola lentus TaxID=2508720 RepID=UPI003F67E16B
MKLSGTHLKRYKEIIKLLWKYSRSDIVRRANAAADGDEAELIAEAKGDITPDQLADDLEAMGPTYIKLGQVLAGRPDLLPPAYQEGLSRLQDKVKPFSFAEVEQIVVNELGVRLSKAFSSFDPVPIAAASLGQVHEAVLRDGRLVVVKVQRPDIRKQIAEDFEILDQIATLLDDHTQMGHRYRFKDVVEEFRITLRQELNYELEAQNLITVGRNLAKFPLIQIPQPIPDYFTKSVLTMERIEGRKITAIGPLDRMELQNKSLVEELFKAYLQQVLVDGIFHADPHPGNVFITNDHRLALLDLGMVGHSTPGMQENLLKLLLALSDGNGEDAADIVVRMSTKTPEFNSSAFRQNISRLVARRRDQGLQELNVGRALLDMGKHSRESGLLVPSELTLLGKTLLQLDEIGRALDPEFDPNAAIRRNVSDLMAQRMRKDFSRGNVFSSMLDMKDFVSMLPSRLNRIMDAVSNSELEIKVKAVDSTVMMEGMEKIANRITCGIVLAGLLVGASLLMRVQTRFQIFGYPGFAMLCFVAAAIGGFWLVISIFLHDYRTRKKYRR